MKNLIFTSVIIFTTIAVTTPFTIDCYFNEDSYQGIIGKFYKCYVKITDNPSNHTITDVTGRHQTGKTNDDVTELKILGDDTLTFVPRGASKFFPNLIAVRIWETAIETVEGDEFAEFGAKLEWLQLMWSALTTIPSHFLAANTNLKYVDLAHNKIIRVGRDLFTPVDLTKLYSVDFKYNRCIARAETTVKGIRELIEELKEACAFDDEVRTTTSGSGAVVVRGLLAEIVLIMVVLGYRMVN
jgi:hypothetical protein